MPTQQEYNVAKQRNRELYAKVEVLNTNLQVVGIISGIIVGNPSFTNDSNNSIRRTCSFEFFPKDSSFNIEEGSKIWLDKYFKAYLGIYDIHNKEIVYTNMGIYLMDNPSQSFAVDSNKVTISGYDLMAKLTGLRGGNLSGLDYVIPQGSNVRNVLIETLALFGFNRYLIDEYPIVTPYEINISAGGCAYDIINELLNILPNWQAYFDVDGVFHFDRIPSGYQEAERVKEQVMVSDDLWRATVVGYNIDYDTQNIKNYIEVLGRTHDNALACSPTTIVNNAYHTTCSSVVNLVDSLVFGFTTPNTILSNPKLQIDLSGGSTTAYNIRVEDGSVPTLKPNTYYVVQYVVNGAYYKFLGGLQPYAISRETNPDSPFYVNNSLGVLRIVLSGGNYDNINSDYLAQQRAEFELYQRCRLQNSLTLTCVPIYWLDTNWLIEITLPDIESTNRTTKQFLIKSIQTNVGTDGTQTIQLMRYYPYYNF